MSGTVGGESAGKTMGSTPHEESTGSRPQDSGHNGNNDHKLDDTWTVTLTPTSMTDSSKEDIEAEEKVEEHKEERKKPKQKMNKGKAEYTAKKGQYSPNNPPEARKEEKKEKEEDITVNSEPLLSTETCTNGLPLGEYTSVDRRGEYTPDDNRGIIQVMNKEQTEISPIGRLMTQDEFKDDSGLTNSPITSTPGSSPGSNNRSEIIDSELQKSEESMIGTTMMVEEEKTKNQMCNEETVEMITQDDEDSNWMTMMTESDTDSNTDIDSGNEGGFEPTSCIARRTRSHARGLRKENLTILLGETEENTLEWCPKTKGVIANDSITLAKQINNMKEEEKEDMKWDKREDWCRSMVNLNKSIEKTKKMKNTKGRKNI